MKSQEIKMKPSLKQKLINKKSKKTLALRDHSAEEN
jgi:hypothetical protein